MYIFYSHLYRDDITAHSFFDLFAYVLFISSILAHSPLNLFGMIPHTRIQRHKSRLGNGAHFE